MAQATKQETYWQGVRGRVRTDRRMRPGRPAERSLSKELLGRPGDGGGARPAKN